MEVYPLRDCRRPFREGNRPGIRPKGWYRMTKLERLREAEEKARREIEKAEKEAQRIRLSLPDLYKAERRKMEKKLEEEARVIGERVEKRLEEIRRELEAEMNRRVKDLSARRESLEVAAEERLRRIILAGEA